MTNEHPYKECYNCKTINDCPHPDIVTDISVLILESKLPPDNCPRAIDVMNETYKQKRVDELKKSKSN